MSEGGVQRDVSRTASGRILAVVVLATAVLGSLIVHRVQATIGDEYAYLPQIQDYLRGQWSVRKDLAVPPTYHFVIASLGRLLGVDSFDALRLISLLLFLPAVLWFYLAARQIDADTAVVRTYQFLFLPILLPYCFLLYTEPLAVLFLVLAVWLVLKRQDTLGGLACLLSAAVRQTLAVWLGFLFFWIYLREEGLHWSVPAVKRHLPRCWVFLLGFAALVVFIVLNHGLTLGELKDFHPPGAISLGNTWFALLLGWLLLLPLHLANMGRIAGLFSRQGVITVPIGLGLILAGYLLTFHNDHPSNLKYPDFLHNQLLVLVFTNIWTKTAFFLPIAWTLLSLPVTPLHGGTGCLLYPFWVLSMLPVVMIEQRYALPGFVLFLLLRKLAGLGWKRVWPSVLRWDRSF